MPPEPVKPLPLKPRSEPTLPARSHHSSRKWCQAVTFSQLVKLGDTMCSRIEIGRKESFHQGSAAYRADSIEYIDGSPSELLINARYRIPLPGVVVSYERL